MKEYVENMKEYGLCEKYEEICRYVGFGTPVSIIMGLGTWKNSKHRLHIVAGTWKNSEFSPSILYASGLGKILRPSFLLGI